MGSPGSDLDVGDTIANYKIVSHIGSGGSGTLYKAKQENLDRFFAIKVLHKHLAWREENILRFEREAAALAAIEHPDIVKVLNVGTLPQGQPYIVMDYLDGSNLHKTLRQEKRMHWKRCARLFARVAEAFAAAHAVGVIHRDIKPTNLLLCKNHSLQEVIRVLDFGFAKIRRQSLSDGELTDTGDMIGTPMYMSPEQCVGKDLDERSDVYSLGCVLYEALSGEPVVSSQSLFQCMHDHLSTAPRPLSDFKDLRLPAEVVEIVKRALAKDAKDRYQSMTELAADLIGIQNLQSHGREAPAFLSTMSDHFVGAFQRQRRIATVSIAAIALVAAAIGVQLSQSALHESMSPTRIELDRQVAVIENEINRLRAKHADGQANEMSQKLHQIKSILGNPYVLPASDIPEAHAVYAAPDAALDNAQNVFISTGKEREYKEPPPPEVEIRVTYRRNPITLIILADTYAKWHVVTDKGVRLNKIIIDSGLEQMVGNVPPGVPVEKAQLPFDICTPPIYNSGTLVTETLRRWLSAAMKLPVATIEQLAPQAVSNKDKSIGKQTVVVGPENRDWKTQYAIFRMTDLYDEATRPQREEVAQSLKSVSFTALVHHPTLLNGPEVEAQDEGMFEPQVGFERGVGVPGGTGFQNSVGAQDGIETKNGVETKNGSGPQESLGPQNNAEIVQSDTMLDDGIYNIDSSPGINSLNGTIPGAARYAQPPKEGFFRSSRNFAESVAMQPEDSTAMQQTDGGQLEPNTRPRRPELRQAEMNAILQQPVIDGMTGKESGRAAYSRGTNSIPMLSQYMRAMGKRPFFSDLFSGPKVIALHHLNSSDTFANENVLATFTGPEFQASDALGLPADLFTSFAHDPNSSVDYALHLGGQVWSIDRAKKKAQLLAKFPKQEQRTSASGLAFDWKRSRIILLTSGEFGTYVYELSLKSQKWSKLSEIPEVMLTGLGYDGKLDKLISCQLHVNPVNESLVEPMSDVYATIDSLRILSPEGKIEGHLPLSPPLSCQTPALQVIPCQEKLILISSATHDFLDGQYVATPHFYVADGKTGKIMYSTGWQGRISDNKSAAMNEARR